MTKYHPTPLEIRFWKKVTKSDDPDGCWLWTGALNHNGYGVINKGARSERKIIRAHHVSWMIHNKDPIPDDKQLLHSCDVRNCVNPKHLFLGTDQENKEDMHRKNRNPIRNELGRYEQHQT